MSTFTFDGKEIEFCDGQTIGAALVHAGIVSWRRTREHDRPRGLFCGIGICFDCLLEIDGQPNVRACLAPAQPDATVRTQDGTGHDELR